MRRSILLLFAAAPLLLGGGAAPRCDCGPRASVPWALREATAVFSGRVVSTRGRKVRFRVERAWKGAAAGAVVEMKGQYLRRNGTTPFTTCDFFFELGEWYLVYAHGPPERLETNACTRTTSALLAANDLEALDNPGPLPPDDRLPPSESSDCGSALISR
jgi:hypothetical protein